MSDPSLNDEVRDWGVANHGITSYDPAKYKLTEAYNQDAVGSLVSPPNYNEGLFFLTNGVVAPSGLLLEIGDDILLESGDRLLLEA